MKILENKASGREILGNKALWARVNLGNYTSTGKPKCLEIRQAGGGELARVIELWELRTQGD